MLRTLCIFVLAAVSAVVGRAPPFYRRDYQYVERYDAFYKLHGDLPLSYNAALLTCKDEGATLFYPKTSEEWKVVNDLTASPKTQHNMSFIFVGIHNQLGIGEFITINGRPGKQVPDSTDGQPTPLPIPDSSSELASPSDVCVLMNTDDGSFLIDSCKVHEPTRPFVCKRDIDDRPCPTIDAGYKFVKERNKCYKFNYLAKTWRKAMQTCFMEGGSLVIVEDYEEANILQKLQSHTSDVQSPDQEPIYYVGFRKLYNSDFFTVKGDSFVDGFYNSYNINNWDKYSDCGTMVFRHNDVPNYNNDDRRYLFGPTHCTKLLPFICEIDA